LKFLILTTLKREHLLSFLSEEIDSATFSAEAEVENPVFDNEEPNVNRKSQVSSGNTVAMMLSILILLIATLF